MESTRKKRVEQFLEEEGNQGAQGDVQEGGVSEKDGSFKAWHRDYEDSNVDLNPEDSSEDEDWVKGPKPKKTIYPKYNPNVYMTDFKWENGMTFNGHLEFKVAVIRYAAFHGVDVWYKKNNKVRVQVKCRGVRVQLESVGSNSSR